MTEVWFLLWWVWLILVIVFAVIYNNLIHAKNDVENNKSTIQTVLQNRYDLIPNLVEVVKQYVGHEQKVIEQVTTMRAELVQQKNVDAKSIKGDATLTWALKTVFALSESYPDLKANTNFIKLQYQWSELEDRLQAARRWYNYAVTILINKKETFPSNIIAGMMNLSVYELFEWSLESQNAISAKDLFAAK